MFAKTGIIFVAIFLAIEAKPSALDTGNACVAQYLKEKNKLPQDFPVPHDLEMSKCRLVVSIIMKAFENALCAKLTDHETIKAGCIMDEIKDADALEYMLVMEIIVMTKGLEEEEMKQKNEETKETLRNIFQNAAKVCESDPTFAGLFNDILEIRNESLAVLRQNYCFTKFAIESKLIDVKDIDVNPKKIVTSNIDCKTMIKNNRIEREKKLSETLKARNYSEEQTQCIMDKFQIDRAFDSNLALEVIDQLDVTMEVRRTNREKIAKQLEKFIKSIFVCAGKMAVNGSDAVSIMSF